MAYYITSYGARKLAYPSFKRYTNPKSTSHLAGCELDQGIWGARVSKIHYFWILSLKYLHNALKLYESRPKIQF